MSKIDIPLLKDKLIADFTYFLMLDVVEEYLNIAKDHRFKTSFLFEYLNSSISYVKGIDDLKNEALINQIQLMSDEEVKQINRDLDQYPNFKTLFEKLNFIYNVIKNEHLQYKVFEFLCAEHITNKKTPQELTINWEQYQYEQNFFNMTNNLFEWPTI